MARRARPTIRCLRDDLGIALPRHDVDLGSLDNPVLRKARGLAPSYPANQVRLDLVKDRLAFKFSHGRLRVADWLEASRAIVWVVGAGLREEGSPGDVYVRFGRLYEAGTLWPTSDDYLRDRLEEATRLLRQLRADARAAIDRASREPGHLHKFLVANRIRIVLLIQEDQGIDEIWLAVLTPDTERVYLSDEEKQMVFAAFREAAREAEWDEPGRWIDRPLRWDEAALLGLRERR